MTYDFLSSAFRHHFPEGSMAQNGWALQHDGWIKFKDLKIDKTALSIPVAYVAFSPDGVDYVLSLEPNQPFPERYLI